MHDNGWTSDGLLSIEPLWTNLSEFLIKIHLIFIHVNVWKYRPENGNHFVLASMC